MYLRKIWSARRILTRVISDVGYLLILVEFGGLGPIEATLHSHDSEMR